MNKCFGCGVLLQSDDINGIGYIKNISNSNNLCERCFRIKNYGEYKLVVKDNSDYIKILKDINKTDDLILLVVDIFNISESLNLIRKYVNNEMILVVTKRDLLPRNINDWKLLEYFDKYNLNLKDKIIISSNKNYNFDELYNMINNYKKSNNVYVIGFTNAGKSTMINKIIYNYSTCNSFITTSILPSTTLNKIVVKLNDELNIIDTPGLLESGSLYDVLESCDLKKIMPKKEIKPISYQVKGRQFILIEKFLKLDLMNINIILFISNNLSVNRFYKDIDSDNLVKHHIKVDNNDIVINGLGFIKVVGKGFIDVYTLEGVTVYTRNSLI